MALAPDLCGTVLDDRYELEALIGEGAFGRVYRGRDRRLHRAVAVKVIKPWWAEDPDWAQGFTREARLLAAINDPGIVAIHDIGHGPEGPYYVSELVEGENLAVRLHAGAIGAAEARSIAIGLCRGLAAAHALRIIHRDVKPANVLLADGADGVRVKVTDFGVARLAEATSGGQLDSIVAGTPRYMAPEQGRGGVVTAAADVYSAGAVLYEMLAGAPPFEGVSAVQLALAHLSDPPPPLPDDVPADLRRVVARALAKDPGDRYVDGAAMADALASSLGSDPDATRVEPRRGPRTLLNPAARRRSVALFTLALGILGALIVAAVLLGGHDHDHDHDRGHRGARIAAAPPVEVPLLINEDATAARARLAAQHLHARLVAVPAPGIRAGTVTSQTPIPGATTRAGSTVTLDVSEVPRWRTVTTFTARSSPTLSIVGERWRILATVESAHHCTLLIFCHSTSATVTAVGSRAPLRRVDLGDGTATPSILDTGPGDYRVTVTPASGATRWSIEVQDDY